MLFKIDGQPSYRAIGIEREVSDQKAAGISVTPAAITPHVNTRPGRRSKRRPRSLHILRGQISGSSENRKRESKTGCN